MRKLLVSLTFASLISACAGILTVSAEEVAHQSITSEDLAKHIEKLFGVEFLSHGLAAEGEIKSGKYLVDSFRKAVGEGDVHGNHTQSVLRIEVMRGDTFSFTVKKADQEKQFITLDDLVAFDAGLGLANGCRFSNRRYDQASVKSATICAPGRLVLNKERVQDVGKAKAPNKA